MIIAFMGRAKSGKDTACAVLKEEFDAVKLAFADPLKAVCHDIFGKAFGVPSKAFYGSQDDKNRSLESYGLGDWSGRKILQYIGTEGYRHIDSEVWPRYAAARVKEYKSLFEQHPDKGQLVIVFSDARFQSEVDVVHELGGVIVRLTRDPAQNGNEGIAGHASEMEMDQIEPDFIIDNANNTLPEFKEQVLTLARSLMNE